MITWINMLCSQHVCPSWTCCVQVTPRDESSVPVCSPLARVDAHRGFVSSLKFSPLSVGGGLLASAGNDHAVRVWRVSTGGLLSGASMDRVWESSASPDAGGHVGAVSALAWVGPTDDGTAAQLFSGSWDGTLKCWQGEKPQLHYGASGDSAASLAGSAGNGGAAPLATLKGHTARVTAVEAAPGGHVVISTSADFTARLWRRHDPFVCLAVYRATASDGVLTSISVGRTIFVTGSESGGILVWPLRSAADAPASGRSSRDSLVDNGSSATVAHPSRVDFSAGILGELPAGGLRLPAPPTGVSETAQPLPRTSVHRASYARLRSDPAQVAGVQSGTGSEERGSGAAEPSASRAREGDDAAAGDADHHTGSDHSAASKAPLLGR